MTRTKSMLIIAAGAATIATLAAMPADARINNPSKFRQIGANGVGNCVFSPQPLPYGNENAAGYRAIRSEFREGENVHVRCYWPKTGTEYRSVGKIWNSIRDRNKHWSALVWEQPPEVAGSWPDYYVVKVETTYDATWNAADQQRFDIYQEPDCDFKLLDAAKRSSYGVTSPHQCIDLSAFARNAPMRDQLKDKSTFRYCVVQYVEAADKTVETRWWDAALKKYRYETKRQPFDHYMARGCFTYRLNS